MILHDINDSNGFLYLDYLTKYDPPAPYWFQLLSFSMAHCRKIYFDIGKLDSFIYYLLFNAPKNENDQPNVNPFLVEFDKFLTKLEPRDRIILYTKKRHISNVKMLMKKVTSNFIEMKMEYT